MNAQAHLISLGWAGPGHSLDSRPDGISTYKQKGHRGLAYDPARDPAKVGNTGTGLVKPLSISQRKARFGIGKKAHEPASGTDWWLKGFESALGNIGKSESERSSGVSTPVNNAATRFNNGGGKHGGLYGFFIKGQLMQGTIEEQEAEQLRGKKRKSDALEDGSESSEGVSSGNSTESKNKKAKKASKDFEVVAAFIGESRKDEKRKKRKDKTGEVEQFDQISQFFDTRDGAEKKRRKQKPDSALIADVAARDSLTNSDVATKTETKEERRERRRKRKERKELKAKLQGSSNGTSGVQRSIQNNESDVSDSAARTARKVERKRRKAEKEEAMSKSKSKQ